MKFVAFGLTGILAAAASLQGVEAQEASPNQTLPAVEVQTQKAPTPKKKKRTSSGTQLPGPSQSASQVMQSAVDSSGSQTSGERGDGPVDGYRATRTLSGAKTDTPLKDIPQDIAVVPRQAIEDKGATNAGEALKVVGGVTPGNNFGGLNNYTTTIRGFETATAAWNGIISDRRYQADDMASVERVEVLMGPSGALYGRSDPSGFYNIVTKKPLDYNFVTATAAMGSYGMFRETIDANYALNESKTLLARVNFAADNRDSFRDFNESDRLFVAPVITYKPSSDWRFTVEGEYMNDKRVFDRGIVAPGGDVFAVPRSRFLGEPNDGQMRAEHGMASVRIEHDLNKDWTISFTQLLKEGVLVGTAAEPGSFVAGTTMITRSLRYRDFYSRGANTQIEAVGHVNIAGFHNTLVLGGEREYMDIDEFNFRSGASVAYGIDYLNPIYGAPKPVAPMMQFLDRFETYSAYASLQTEWTSRLKTMVSVRYDDFHQEAELQPAGRSFTQDHHPVTPKFGVTYDLTPNITLFGDLARSFKPNVDSDSGFLTSVTGAPFDPQEGIGYEGGVKLDLIKNQLSVTAAGFHIVKENVLTTDPTNSSNRIAAGEVTSDGMDVNIVGNITPEWRVIGGYAYIDARVTKDNTLVVGSDLVNVPRNSASLFSVYEWQSGALRGFGLGGGVYFVGDRAGDSANSFTVPSYTTFDALAYYNLDQDTKISLNVYNLFDKEYVDTVRSSVNVYPGAPRTALFTIKHTF